jgi:hypothetical protein
LVRIRRMTHIPIDRSMTAGRRVRPVITPDENLAMIATRPRTMNAAARSSTIGPHPQLVIPDERDGS